MTLLQLPDELLQRIAECTILQHHPADLLSPYTARQHVASLSLTCKRLGRVARPLLFSALKFTYTHKADTIVDWYKQRNEYIFSTTRPTTVKELVLHHGPGRVNTDQTDPNDARQGVYVPLTELLASSSLSPAFALVLNGFDSRIAERLFRTSSHRINRITIRNATPSHYTSQITVGLPSDVGTFLKATTLSSSLTLANMACFVPQALEELWTCLAQASPLRELRLFISARWAEEMTVPPFKQLTNLALSAKLLSGIVKSGSMESLPQLQTLEVCGSSQIANNSADACSDTSLAFMLELCPNLRSLRSPIGFESLRTLPASLVFLDVTHVLRGSTLSPCNLSCDVLNGELPNLSVFQITIDWDRFYESIKEWNARAFPSERWVSIDDGDILVEEDGLSMLEQKLQAYFYPYLEGFRKTFCNVLDDCWISYHVTPLPIYMMSCKPPFKQLKITHYYKYPARSSDHTGTDTDKPILSRWESRIVPTPVKLYELEGWKRAAPRRPVLRKKHDWYPRDYIQTKLDTFLSKTKA